MIFRVVPLLAASILAGTSLSLAQGSRPWVDPPANLSAPTEKPRNDESSKPAPVASPPKAEVKAEPAKAEAPSEKTEPKQAVKEAPAPKRKHAVAKPARPKVAARAQARSRVAQQRIAPGQRADGLEVMQMQTLQFPDGRTVTVLTRPGEAPNPAAAFRDGWR